MIEVKQSSLEKQGKVVESKFKELEAKRQEFIEQGKVINQNISAIAEEMLRLQGEFRALEGLKDNGADKPALIIPGRNVEKKN